MSSNSSQGPNYIISNVLGCVLIISDNAFDVWEMLEVLIFRPVWLDSRIIFCQEIASHPIRGSAEKDSSCSTLAAIARRMHRISSDLRS